MTHLCCDTVEFGGDVVSVVDGPKDQSHGPTSPSQMLSSTMVEGNHGRSPRASRPSMRSTTGSRSATLSIT